MNSRFSMLLGCSLASFLGIACNGGLGSSGAGANGSGGTGATSGGTAGSGANATGGTTMTGGSSGSGTGAGGSGGTTETTSSSGGAGGSSPTDPCTGASEGNHCGSDLGGLADHNSLYACASGATTNVTPCPSGCASGACLSPPQDPCAGASSGDGAYCGASLGAGDPNTLYTCQGKTKVGEKVCPNGCKVQPPGTPDSCNPSGDPCAYATAGNGAYCGGSLKKPDGTVVGDLGVLYDCQNMGTSSQTTCPNGCQIMPPGVADACAPVDGQCCLNKPPGVQTQAYSACGAGGVHYGIDYGTPVNTPIYAGMSGTVVSSALGFPNCYDNGCSPSCWNSFNYVKLKSDCGDPAHAGNDLFIYYLHINDLGPGVGNGTHVDKGQLLAYSGNSGCSSGPHIHIETATVAAGGSVSLSTCKSENPAARYCQ